MNRPLSPTALPPADPQASDVALWHSAFYAFAALADPPQVALRLKDLTAKLHGSILVASEGINGMVAAPLDLLGEFEQALVTEFDGAFKGMAFKRSPCLTRPFKHMKIKVKREIVPLGVDGVNAINQPRHALTPMQWREMLQQDDVVVLDNRNSFEFKLGRFKGAIDPGVQHFRDFPRYVEEHLPGWQAQGKRVAMYCTGGIRCEKTSAWLLQRGVEVLELEGGILNYFQQLPDAEKEWQGECFVFDNRVALDTHLHETGTTPEQVYQNEPDGQWRINRARRLADSE